MSIEADRRRLSQVETLQFIQCNLQMTEMIDVYFSDTTTNHHYGVYCALIPAGEIEKVLSKSTWDLSRNGGMPSSVVYYNVEEGRPEYLRFGNKQGIEPLVIDRDFYGIRPNYLEISEEFRLFHRLYHDRTTDQYIKIE